MGEIQINQLTGKLRQFTLSGEEKVLASFHTSYTGRVEFAARLDEGNPLYTVIYRRKQFTIWPVTYRKDYQDFDEAVADFTRILGEGRRFPLVLHDDE
ncbi:MAG: hypothetical protein LBJ14_00600 [Desulfarculales bacterium]|jgi:hypothetical protein|nr:hypothetical protein [Desulfarculales bacterium]